MKFSQIPYKIKKWGCKESYSNAFQKLNVYECLLACMQVHHTCAVPTEGRREHWTP